MRIKRRSLVTALFAGLIALVPARAQDVTFAEQLERFAGGKPVPLVVAGYGMQARGRGKAVDTAGKEWLPALQAICAGMSRSEDAPESWYIQDVYIPYRFGSVWTLAPDRMWQLDLNLSGADMYAATNREDLVQWLMETMDAGQLRKAGGAGLGWRDLNRDQRDILGAIVRDGLPVRAPEGNGGKARRESPRGTGWLRNATLRFRVAFRGMGTAGEDGSFYTTDSPTNSEAPVGEDLTPSDSIPGTAIRYRRAVAARLKDGDLDFAAAALNPPIGIRGGATLRDAVAAAAKATRLPLRLSPEFDEMPVFIGDASLRTGDVLKCLTFGMQGAWRKVGGTYLLAWDKIGRGTVLQWQKESTSTLRRALGQAKDASRRKDWAALALDNLSPDPDDPFSPTREQMEILAGPGHTDADTDRYDPPRLKFSDLTPAQQAAFRKEFGYAEDRWSTTALEGVKIEVTLSAPGVGESGLTASGANIYPGARQNAAAREQGANGRPAVPVADNSLVFPQPMRAVAAPMLLRGEWPRLIEQMRRKGLDTLYVPVFQDGQTLFPSRYFPQPRAYYGHDVLNEILNAAKPAGIRVVGVLHTLAWRNPGGSEVHWMRKRQGWLDVDVLGRTRREWSLARNLPGKPDGTDWLEDPGIWADYVQPGNAEVRERLMGLAGELRHYPALDGVALDHWMRLAGSNYLYPFPSLGMAMPERAAALEKAGRDPIDIRDMVTLFLGQPSMQWYPDMWDPDQNKEGAARDAFAVGMYEADAALASEMLKPLRETWPRRVEVFSPTASPFLPDGTTDVEVTARQHRPLPKVDAVISSRPAPGKPGQYRWLPAPRLSTDAAANEERLARAAIRMQRLAVPPVEGEKVFSGIVLDFTTAPDLLWPCLRLLANRGQNG